MNSPYLRIMRLDKPIGIGLLLWPTLWALWLAYGGMPPPTVCIVFGLGTILMRSAGCVINDIADRNFDGKVERTNQRPLATGELTLTQAVVLFIVLLSLSACLLLFLNITVITWAIIGALLAIMYPFCKRFFDAPQLILGFAFSWGIPIAFINANRAISSDVIILMFLNLCWIICYDTYYAMVDKQDDLLISIRSTAIFFGKHVLNVILCLQVLIACLWLYLGLILKMKFGFYLIFTFAHMLFFYQYNLARQHTRENYFKAFLNNNWYGMMMFLAIIVGL